MAKVQQIIQHRKGCIDKVKDINSYISEIIYGTGNIGDITGNVVFIGNQNSGSGNYSPISRIYFGVNAPTVNAYKNTLNGLPFYSVYDKTLYILNNPKNIDMDLSGNIFRRNIAPNNISASGFISGNSLNITGDVKLGKNDSNIIEINGKIKGSLIPLTSNTYDLGTPTNKWRNIYATLISGSFEGDGSNLKNLNTSMSVEVIGQTTSTYNISLPNEKLSVYTNPTNGIDLTIGSKRIEIIPFDATYSQKGVSYYNNSDFIVNSGYVSIDQTRFNQLSASFKDFTSSLNSYTSSVDNYSKVFNTALNQILVGSSSYSNTLNVNVLSNSSINLKLDDNLQISSSITTTNIIANGTLYTSGSAFIGSYLQVSGNLYVNGSVTVIDSINVNIGDNIIGLNAAGLGLDGGIYVYDNVGGTSTGSLLWDVTNNWWKAGVIGNEKRIVFQENSTNLTENSLTYANSNGRLISAIAPTLNDIPIWNGTTWNNVNLSKFATTSSLGDFTSSLNSWTASLNIWTGSVSSSLNSLNLYTSSNNVILNNFSSFSSSINIWTGSVNTTLNNFSVYTSSLNITTGSFFKQGGNSFGTNAVLGTNDNYSLNFETNGSTRLSISSFGNISITSSLEIGENLTINGDTYINGILYDVSLAAGAATQFLRSTATGVQWTTPQMSNINGLLNYTSSVSSSLNSLNLYTSSNNVILNNFSAYTSSFNTTFNNYTSSVNNSLTGLNSFSASIKSYTSSLNTWTGSFSQSVYTQFQSVNTSLSSLNSFSSSVNIWTGSVSSSLNSINSYTSSLNIATGSFFKQGGNSFGQSGSLGTNDNYSLSFKTNNSVKAILGTDGKFTLGTVSSPTALLNIGGDVIATGDVSAYSSSDIRLKKNILKIENPSKILSKIHGYTYQWNDKQTLYKLDTKDIGLIAQEVEKVLPEIIGKRYDGYKSIKYERLIAVLVEAFNEMRLELDYLKGRL